MKSRVGHLEMGLNHSGCQEYGKLEMNKVTVPKNDKQYWSSKMELVVHCKYMQWNYSGNWTQLKSVHFTFNCHIQSNVEVTVKKL